MLMTLQYEGQLYKNNAQRIGSPSQRALLCLVRDVVQLAHTEA